MTLGTTDCIQGLEIGLAGDEGPMPAMKYVIPTFIKSKIDLMKAWIVHGIVFSLYSLFLYDI